MRILIDRITSNEISTLGILYVVSDEGYILYECNTLELPYKDNQRNISCIPKGDYQGKKRWSEKYGNHIHILNVPNRSFILIHPANFAKQLRGCVAVGIDFADIDNDESLDLIHSKKAMEDLLDVLPDEFPIFIS